MILSDLFYQMRNLKSLYIELWTFYTFFEVIRKTQRLPLYLSLSFLLSFIFNSIGICNFQKQTLKLRL